MLTKSNFKNFVACRNEYWLDYHFPESKPEPSFSDQHRRETGYEVERLARKLPIFAGGQGVEIEFGKVFETEELYAKADIIVTNTHTGEIQIYEVKSGTSVKKDYQIDLTFQYIVAKKCGKSIKGAFLITVDSSYVFDGTLHSEKLFRVTDETEIVQQIETEVEEEIDAAISFHENEEPIVTLLDYCKANKLQCRYLVRKFPDIPDYNVSNIFQAGSKKLNDLLERGIMKIQDIPNDYKLTAREESIVAVELSGKPAIEIETIRDELQGLAYPLNFLDYESVNLAVPKFPRTRAYQQMVFQYSLHTINQPGGDITHSFHLSRNNGEHPTLETIKRLHEDLHGRVGTVIAWSEGFEKTRNTEMGEMFPEFADFLAEINDNVYDLRKIFSRRLFMHPEFRGKDSIKKVLPVLCPQLSYQGMGIGDGLTASIKWYHMATGRGTVEKREETYQELTDYCKLDTLAMVEIFRVLSVL